MNDGRPALDDAALALAAAAVDALRLPLAVISRVTDEFVRRIAAQLRDAERPATAPPLEEV